MCFFFNFKFFGLSKSEQHTHGTQEDMVPLWSLWELVAFGKALKQVGTKRTARIPYAAELCATWTLYDVMGDEKILALLILVDASFCQWESIGNIIFSMIYFQRSCSR